MKILALGDLHYNLRQFDWLVTAAAQVDLVVIAGDLLDIAGHVDIDAQIIVARTYLQRLQKVAPMLVCSGNHDGDHQNAAGEFVAGWLAQLNQEQLWGDGASIEHGGWRFTACPWWDGEMSRAEVLDFLEAEAQQAKERWILVHHAPPAASPVSWTGKRNVGDPFLREFIERHQPHIVLSGHVHNAPFRSGGAWFDRIGETWIFNPGRQLGEFPAYLLLDLEAQSVTWDSAAGIETLQLANGCLVGAS